MSGNPIYDEFETLVTGRRHHRARGFINIDCPSCGDRRQRGGFAPTNTGGFRYFCFNGGCDFNVRPTGWEPGNGLGGRPRKLFELFGGNIRRLPAKELMRPSRALYDRKGNVIGEEKKLDFITKFPAVDLPAGSDLLVDAARHNRKAGKVLDYLKGRGEFYVDAHPFCWSPEYPTYLIIPFLHSGDRIVGFLGRNIYRTGGAGRFIQTCPEDYVFNQHRLWETPGRYVFVMEAPMDAIAVQGLATRSNRLTERQINLLKASGREPILIPDIRNKEHKPFLETAQREGWGVSIPARGRVLPKDVGESVAKNGLLYTIESITAQMTKNYRAVEMQLARGL